MDHSYSSGKDCSRERERLRKQDHCYFLIANKTPEVIKRKQLLESEEWSAIRGRDDHTYGRRALLCEKENSSEIGTSLQDVSPQSPVIGVTAKFATLPDHQYPRRNQREATETKDSHDRDHTYFDKNRPRKPARLATRSHYDHEYCTAMEAEEGDIVETAAIEEASTGVALRDCGCPATPAHSPWWALDMSAGCRSPLTASSSAMSIPNVIVSSADVVM
ncbi:hypothetical protein CAPTEDRAFT_229225 [Capitella teleta]|uniref:Uncharacterized protein n=1 Tax=Capitella teleta TaxID=283909 RepID=R7TWI6_CAPTE|nr:hypothetical protein CAPTEDRAFT_229225 [Capitella teleta]|eukprot:ELT97962.1 hypothetical protein CAPTEDRAFT_229225 [Capitella teleta]